MLGTPPAPPQLIPRRRRPETVTQLACLHPAPCLSCHALPCRSCYPSANVRTRREESALLARPLLSVMSGESPKRALDLGNGMGFPGCPAGLAPRASRVALLGMLALGGTGRGRAAIGHSHENRGGREGDGLCPLCGRGPLWMSAGKTGSCDARGGTHSNSWAG